MRLDPRDANLMVAASLGTRVGMPLAMPIERNGVVNFTSLAPAKFLHPTADFRFRTGRGSLDTGRTSLDNTGVVVKFEYHAGERRLGTFVTKHPFSGRIITSPTPLDLEPFKAEEVAVCEWQVVASVGLMKYSVLAMIANNRLPRAIGRVNMVELGTFVFTIDLERGSDLDASGRFTDPEERAREIQENLSVSFDDL